MQEFATHIRQALAVLTQYDWIVACAAVAIAAGLIREMLDSAMLALFAVPLMLIGALAANYLVHTNYISPVSDADTNVVMASAVGVLVAISLLFLSMWLISIMSERSTKHKRLIELPPRSADD